MNKSLTTVSNAIEINEIEASEIKLPLLKLYIASWFQWDLNCPPGLDVSPFDPLLR